MPNDNPQAVKFANEIIRPMADAMQGLTDSSEETISRFANEGLLALFPLDDEVVVDGSATDGRAPITNRMVRIVMDILTSFRNDMKANDSIKYNQIEAVSVNSRRVY